MRRLTLVVGVAALAVAAWAMPSLAARHAPHARRATAYRRTAGATSAAAAGLRSSLAPSVPADPTIDGAAPGGKPWVLKSGEVTIAADGRTTVRLTGFLIPKLGVGPVKTLTASLYCAGATKPVATTPAAKLAASGDAVITGMLTPPKTCLAPTVLVHPNGAAASYVAATGWAS